MVFNMSEIRVHKSKNFTVMSNIHLRDKNLSLKAKGLLSVMLSLPDNWSYSIAGLVAICKENETAVKSALNELKTNRYVIVKREKPSIANGGRIKYSYEVYEEPKEPEETEKAKEKEESHATKEEKQGIENLWVEIQYAENSGQLNTNKLNTDKSNTNDKKNKTLPIGRDDKNFSLSDEREKPKPKTAKERYLDKKANELKMQGRMLTIAHDKFDKEIADEVFNGLCYYLAKYTEKTNLIHPILTDNTLTEIITKLGTFQTDYGDKIVDCPNLIQDMIDEFFNTDFGSRTGQKTNWNLPHFMSDTVLNMLSERLK